MVMSLTTGFGKQADGAGASAKQQAEHAAPRVHVHTNRLADETSPYLLQHAHNPVDWHPWGGPAFEKAGREDKPVFLSIGYSTCHWCHVMERESFESEAVAAVLNAHFISIKVDREERPDVDRIYMTAVQMMTGSGGWPLSVFLTPDLKPFFGGTYFPPEDRFGRPGFMGLLKQIAGLWKDQRPEITRRAAEAADAISLHLDGKPAEPPGTALQPEPEAAAGALRRRISRAAERFVHSYDRKWGGFGSEPKFPPSGALALLMRQYERTGDAHLLRIVTHTLDRMAYGGIHDQIGGGFHRYSVDRKWLVPHFEKMLYDNALLSRNYLEAYQLTKHPLYRRVAVDTLDYVIREMTDRHGAFHSAEDADSEGKEGKFYTWTPVEIEAALGPKDADLFSRYYGTTGRGNFDGRNILNVKDGIESFAQSEGIPVNGLEKRLANLRRKLLVARNKRVRPGRDDKVLSSWNGLMISSLAKGYRILGEKRFLHAARNAGAFIRSNMTDDGSGLPRTCRSGRAGISGYLDDYANVINAFLDLYEASLDPDWLSAARRLTERMIDLFWDEPNHGFYFTSEQHRHLLARAKPYTDGSLPSGNSAAATALLRLAVLLGRNDYRVKAVQTVHAAMRTVGDYPQACPYMLCAGDLLAGPITEVAVFGATDHERTRELLDMVYGDFRPRLVLAFLDPEAEGAAKLRENVPLLGQRQMLEGKTTAYVCRDYSCREPATDPDGLSRALRGLSNRD